MAIPNIQPDQYAELLAAKQQKIDSAFAAFNLPAIEVFESLPSNYRLRAEFRVWHDGDELNYVMFEPGDNKNPVAITECEMVSERIRDMMFPMLEVIKHNQVLRQKLFQIDFLSTLSGELLVSLLYHRPIDEEWQQQVNPLREQFDIDIVGRSRKKKQILNRDFVMETLHINGRDYHYKQIENSFTQPNGKVCEKMVEWALDVSENSDADLIEFYCGHGTFTLPLAQNYNRVVACEISKTSVSAARTNIELNQIENVDVVRMSSEELTQVLQGTKQTRKVAGLALEDCDFSTVLVDPPRSGLDALTVKQVSEYENIIYISCNPETLKENLQDLTQTHDIKRFAIFDQFPYTEHLECGVYLTRK
jgi:tRNA (uracil-5-)-methyltransferase